DFVAGSPASQPRKQDSVASCARFSGLYIPVRTRFSSSVGWWDGATCPLLHLCHAIYNDFIHPKYPSQASIPQTPLHRLRPTSSTLLHTCTPLPHLFFDRLRRNKRRLLRSWNSFIIHRRDLSIDQL